VTNIRDIEHQEFSVSGIEQKQFLNDVSYTFNLFADDKTNTLLKMISEGKNDLGIFCIDIIAGIDAPKYLISETKTKNSFALIEGKTIKKYGLHPVKKFIIWKPEEINRQGRIMS
jgi:adenine-specific DNA-methyltransferase